MHSKLLDDLRNLWAARRKEIDEAHSRTLPLGDYVVDRWEKARALGFGEGASIYDSALVIGEVSVGEQSWIGPQVVLDGSGGLTIGSHCSISAGVQIYSHDTVQWAVSGGKAAYERAPTAIGSRCYIGPGVQILTADHPRDPQERRSGQECAHPITIGENVWIGAGALILPGVTIGDGCVIGAGSLVLSDIPAGSKAVGSPCRVIGAVEPTVDGPGSR